MIRIFFEWFLVQTGLYNISLRLLPVGIPVKKNAVLGPDFTLGPTPSSLKRIQIILVQSHLLECRSRLLRLETTWRSWILISGKLGGEI